MWGNILVGFVGAMGGFATAAVVFAGVRANLRSKIILARTELAQVHAEDAALFVELERTLAQTVYEAYAGRAKTVKGSLEKLRAVMKRRP